MGGFDGEGNTLPAVPPGSVFPLGIRCAMEYIRLGAHIWVSVLIMGTMWRIISYHLIASSNSSMQHLGRAMAQQY